MARPKVTTTVLFNGITGAVADVVLNDLSRRGDFGRLRPYFERHGIVQAAGYAAVTVMIGAAIVCAATRVVFGFAVPERWPELALTLATCFGVGYAMDVAIARMHVFAGLEAYYARHGAGAWGGASLVVSMGVALAMQLLVLPQL